MPAIGPQAPDQLRRVDGESTREPYQAVDGQVDLASFDVPDVRPVQAGAIGQLLLGNGWFQGFPLTPDAPADLARQFDAPTAARHIRQWMQLALQTSTA